ncbi:thioesterase family protein [Nocardia yamanashiensis]|uniref:acyl-CoA thioesterase n=1 Tax=Nocardia yamanashiensis TaxID=209247 RepID=UPI001E34A654|nr:thioesterase family protein [Nocardia yamanashiensis]UGT42692.1 thioesterase family protein [Nocardia yamanashiensis]
MATDAAPTHPFDTAVALKSGTPGVFAGRTTPDYGNMVGPFGGITAATLLQAVLDHPERLGDPISLTVNFAGPIAEGEFEIVAEAVRTNRSTQHWVVSLRQGAETNATATVVTGTRRDSWAATEREAPDVGCAESVPVQEVPEGFIAWLRNYEMRFVEGGMDAIAAGEAAGSQTTLWIRDAPARSLDFASLTAMSDAFFPRVFVRLGRMVPASTVSLTVYFHADAELLAVQGDRPVLASARATRFGGGYFDQAGELWSADGELLVTTHQMVYFKA